MPTVLLLPGRIRARQMEAATDRCARRRDNGAVIPLVVGGVWDVFQGYINTRAAEVLTIKAKR